MNINEKGKTIFVSWGGATIASNVGENDKFVLHNENGIICNNNDDFKKAINEFLEISSVEYFEFSKNAIQYKGDYSMKRYCETLIEKYENIIKIDK